MKTIVVLLCVVLLAAAAAAAFVTSGVYDIGADQPHWRLTEKIVATLRDRSIAHQSAGITVPNLDDPERIHRGARRYAEMCAACHLTPGMRSTELREGLYPQPPDLSRRGLDDPAEAFWVIKHGIKMSAMPAWGRSHDDAAIWEMVAFERKLPTMDEAAFEAMAGMPGNDGHGGGHGMHHHDEDEHEHPASSSSAPEGDSDHEH
ncbi:c-type cytochrome [Dyella subtropica]|uniref:c-type cytochrome n=1 Tax=Dyella subtropica TaxID=2992127 RepID=UPI00225A4FCD|nr:cytochrome c [Dyella subtropica]